MTSRHLVHVYLAEADIYCRQAWQRSAFQSLFEDAGISNPISVSENSKRISKYTHFEIWMNRKLTYHRKETLPSGVKLKSYTIKFALDGGRMYQENMYDTQKIR